MHPPPVRHAHGRCAAAGTTAPGTHGVPSVYSGGTHGYSRVRACACVRVRAPSARRALQRTVASSCALTCSSTADSPGVHARAAASLARLAHRCSSNSSCCRLSRRRSREPCAMADPYSIDASRAHIDHTGQYSRDRTISVPCSHSSTRTRPQAHACTHAHRQARARAHACACTHKHTGTRTVTRCPHT